jgi:hypothetical protein
MRSGALRSGAAAVAAAPFARSLFQLGRFAVSGDAIRCFPNLVSLFGPHREFARNAMDGREKPAPRTAETAGNW